MNSKQRRARIRAGMPGAVHRILTMKLVGDLTDTTAERYLVRLRVDKIRLVDFEGIVRAVAELERQAEFNRTLKSYVTPSSVNFFSLPSLPRFPGASPSLSAGYGGRSAHTIVIDEVTQIK